MSKLQGKIDFTLFISVKNANPNGDPLNGNRPRTDIDVYLYNPMSGVTMALRV